MPACSTCLHGTSPLLLLPSMMVSLLRLMLPLLAMMMVVVM